MSVQRSYQLRLFSWKGLRSLNHTVEKIHRSLGFLQLISWIDSAWINVGWSPWTSNSALADQNLVFMLKQRSYITTRPSSSDVGVQHESLIGDNAVIKTFQQFQSLKSELITKTVTYESKCSRHCRVGRIKMIAVDNMLENLLIFGSLSCT